MQSCQFFSHTAKNANVKLEFTTAETTGSFTGFNFFLVTMQHNWLSFKKSNIKFKTVLHNKLPLFNYTFPTINCILLVQTYPNYFLFLKKKRDKQMSLKNSEAIRAEIVINK